MERKEITAVQTAAVLISTTIGVGVLRLPLIAVQGADSGAPFVTFLAVVLICAGLTAVAGLGTLFSNLSFVAYSEKILGQWLGRLYSAVAILFFMVLTALTAREFGLVVVTAVLNETPIEVTVIVMLLMAAVSARHSLVTFTYIHNFYVPMILAPGLIIALLSLKNANVVYLQPIFGNEQGGLLTSVLTIGALLQTGFIISMIIPFMKKPEKAVKATLFGILIASGLYILIVIAVLAVFGPEEVKNLAWPTLELSRATAIGDMLQRLDVVFLSVWVIAVFTTIFSTYMFTSYSLSQLFHLQDHKVFSLFLLPFVFFIAMIPDNVLQMYEIIERIGRGGLIITLLAPVVMLTIAKLRKLSSRKKGGENVA